MDLTTYVERLRSELGVAELNAEAAVRLMLLEALSAAADEITREVAPATVELRLRGGEPEFVVTPVPADEPAPDVVPPEGDTARINLRLPEQLKAGVEQAATREGLSVNSWLVRAVATSLTNRDPARPPQRGGRVGESFTGWVR
jgi:hypothetical protein